MSTFFVTPSRLDMPLRREHARAPQPDRDEQDEAEEHEPHRADERGVERDESQAFLEQEEARPRDRDADDVPGLPAATAVRRKTKDAKELFLLDEPTAGVSPKMTESVASLIRTLKEKGKTVLIVEHDLPFISKICDRVIVLDVGKIMLTGTPHEVKKSKELQELYFGAAD